jgi:hypothetical protein
MTPYNVKLIRANYPGEYRTVLFGKDREDIIKFTKKTYKRVLVDIISVRKVTEKGNEDDTVEPVEVVTQG